MKSSTSLRSYLLKDGLTPTTRSSWQRARYAVEDVDPVVVERGHHIFIYNNIRTNQVIYSFTRTLNNNEALKQLPYLGKKTVPQALRKDLWLPFALVEFPSPLQGIDAFRRLREFRRLHETAYPLDIITVKEGKQKGYLMTTKQRGKVLMDQKANSVADLAAVLWQDHVGPSEEAAKHKERSKRFWDRVNRQKIEAGKPPTERHPQLAVGPVINEVMIRWADTRDIKYTAAFPAYETVDLEDSEEMEAPQHRPELPQPQEASLSA